MIAESGFRTSPPLHLRERYRDLYLRWYHRFFPYGYREFQSADLALPSADALAVDSADPGPSDVGARPKTTQAGDGLPFACHPTYRPKISVVLPVWNQAEFLAGSVRSVLAQSYENLELIVVDDGSDEDLSLALAPWLEDSRVRVLKRPHEGIAAALNAGFREASGDFLTWTSADNLMKPEMLSALLGYLLRRPSVRMAYSNIELIDDRGRPLTGSDVRVMHQRPHVTHQLDLPRSTEALGPLRADFLDVDLLVSTAERHPELDFILVGSDSEALDGDTRLQPQDNLIVLAGRPADTWHIYLSRAAFLWAPLRDEPTLVGAMQEVLLIYLAAGKRVLATDAVRAAGLEDLPNAVIAHRHQCPEGVARVLNIVPDWRIADDYRRTLGPDVVACKLLRTANAQTYGNTMAPLRKGNSR